MRIYPDVLGLRLENTEELLLVEAELTHQYRKWGLQNRTLFEWICYLTEEVGELAEAIAENHYREGTIEHIREEAVQVAALAIKILQITRNEKGIRKTCRDLYRA